MAAGEEKLRLVLEAIDKTTAPLRAMNRRIEALTAPVRKVRNAFSALSREAGLPKLGAALSRVGSLVRNLAIGAVGAGAGLLAFIEKTADAGDRLGEFTQLIGIGVEDFQEYQYAAKIAGIDNEAFAASMKTLSRATGQAQAGTGRLAGLLKKVAPSVLKQLKGTKDTGQALEVVLGAMRKLDKPTQRAALASAAFGNANAGLLATLSPKQLEDFRKEAQNLGVVMSQDAVNGAGALMDKFDKLKASALGLARSIAASLFPHLQGVTDRMLEWIKANKDLIKTKGREWLLKVATAIKDLGIWLSEAVPQFIDFVDHMGGLKGILVGLTVVNLVPLVASIYSLSGAFAALGVSTAPLIAVAAALAGIFFYRKELADFFGLSASPKNIQNAAPREIPGLAAPDTSGFRAVDVSGSIGIDVSGKRPTVTQLKSMNPNIAFGVLSRGRALGAQ